MTGNTLPTEVLERLEDPPRPRPVVAGLNPMALSPSDQGADVAMPAYAAGTAGPGLALVESEHVSSSSGATRRQCTIVKRTRELPYRRMLQRRASWAYTGRMRPVRFSQTLAGLRSICAFGAALVAGCSSRTATLVPLQAASIESCDTGVAIDRPLTAARLTADTFLVVTSLWSMLPPGGGDTLLLYSDGSIRNRRAGLTGPWRLLTDSSLVIGRQVFFLRAAHCDLFSPFGVGPNAMGISVRRLRPP